MADDVTAPGTGVVFASDDVGSGVQVPLTKLAISTDGSRTLIPADGTLGLSVNQAKSDVINDEIATGATAAQTGGLSKYRLISLNTTNGNNIKVSAGRVYGWYVANTNAAARYMKLYNLAGAPTVGTDVPFLTILLPATAAGPSYVSFPPGIAFPTGIAIALTTIGSDADATAVAANEIIVNLFYK